MVHNEFVGKPEGPLWQQVVQDPAVEQLENDISLDRYIQQEALERIHNSGFTSRTQRDAERRNMEAIGDRIHARLRQNFTEILKRYGVSDDDIIDAPRQVQDRHGILAVFPYAGRTVHVRAKDDRLHVSAWDAGLSDEQGAYVDGAYAAYKSAGHHPDDEILATTPPEQDARGYLRWLNEHMPPEEPGAEPRTFEEKYGYASFTVESPRTSWSLPVALSILGKTTPEAQHIVGDTARNDGILHVPEPGVVQARDYSSENQGACVTWELTDDNDMQPQGSARSEGAVEHTTRDPGIPERNSASEAGSPTRQIAADLGAQALIKMLDTMRGSHD